MNKKPEIYKPPINKSINNNEKVFYSTYGNSTRSYKSDEYIESPEDTLNRLSNNGRYIFNTKVIIRTKDKIYDTKIAGKMNGKLITTDGDSILLDNILSIKEK